MRGMNERAARPRGADGIGPYTHLRALALVVLALLAAVSGLVAAKRS
jgi:hypothetical protein